MPRRRVWLVRRLPLVLLIALGVPALILNSSRGLPELSADRAQAIVTNDILRRFAAPYVTNQVTWRSFEWKGEGVTTLGDSESPLTFPARFAQVDLLWTQTRRAPDATAATVDVFGLGYWNNGESLTDATSLNVPSILAFYRTEQFGWRYTWQQARS
ncbi:MAG: hypothetical protein PHU75_08020 [Candidatus Nanopelagicales bacterium]|nr:hypothetical protein [Candidatus Nanopelagicales bacterium]